MIRTIKKFEYENTRRGFECCDYWEKWKTIPRQIILLDMWGTEVAFSDKVTTDIDGFTDEPIVQCVVRFVKIVL